MFDEYRPASGAFYGGGGALTLRIHVTCVLFYKMRCKNRVINVTKHSQLQCVPINVSIYERDLIT